MGTVLDQPETAIDTFERYESNVRSYIRNFPTLFQRAKGSRLWDNRNRAYVDFFSGAGALNYGHNDEKLKRALLQYIESDGITHSLDMATGAKAEFLETFQEYILKPRNLNYKVMFPGPTGTNSVESALKLARKVTGRSSIVSFTNAFHGMTLGSLSVTGNRFKREGAGLPLNNGFAIPYDTYLEDGGDTIELFVQLLDDDGSGMALPAAVIVESVQGEGGINVASTSWLCRLASVCKERDILLIVDDVQMGCGRTGAFFSFEEAGIVPDIVCLSKSISGYGTPMALTLFHPDLDIWVPGEHNGTFRGHNLAFVTATEALRVYWKDRRLEQDIRQKGEIVRDHLQSLIESMPHQQATVRGRGLAYGLDIQPPGIAEQVAQEAFERGLIVETSGAESQVVKLLPALTIDDKGLRDGLSILSDSVKTCV